VGQSYKQEVYLWFAIRVDYNTPPKKKATLASGPKFREETPKKGSNPATPIAVLHCKT
jgi:hypothetical protein